MERKSFQLPLSRGSDQPPLLNRTGLGLDGGLLRERNSPGLSRLGKDAVTKAALLLLSSLDTEAARAPHSSADQERPVDPDTSLITITGSSNQSVVTEVTEAKKINSLNILLLYMLIDD